MLAPGDGLLLVADEQEAIAEAAARLGKLEPGRIVKDRSALDYIRVFVGKANLVGVPLGAAAAAGRLSRRICCMSGATTWTSCRRPT